MVRFNRANKSFKRQIIAERLFSDEVTTLDVERINANQPHSDNRPDTSLNRHPQRAASVSSCVTNTKAVPKSHANCSISSNTPSAVLRFRLPPDSSASMHATGVRDAA